MLRGRMTHRSFATLLESGAIRIESGSGEARDTNVTAASVTSTGGGESAVYRHDFTLRETPASAARRQTQAAEENARLAAAVAELTVMVADVEGDGRDPSGDTWASALHKLESSPNGTATRAPSAPAARLTPPSRPTVPAAPRTVQSAGPAATPASHAEATQPAAAPRGPAGAVAAVDAANGHASLTPTEVAGVEAVLVGLRLEAIIDALDRMQIVPREDLEQAFLRLVQKRFVAEASLVVGEPVARRAARDILQGLGVGRWALAGDR
jgi:hypothetical protein